MWPGQGVGLLCGASDPAGLATTRRTRPPGYMDAQAELPGANRVGSFLPTPPGCSHTFRDLGPKPGGGVRVRAMAAQQGPAGSGWLLQGRHRLGSSDKEEPAGLGCSGDVSWPLQGRSWGNDPGRQGFPVTARAVHVPPQIVPAHRRLPNSRAYGLGRTFECPGLNPWCSLGPSTSPLQAASFSTLRPR